MCFHTRASALLPAHDAFSRTKVRLSLGALRLPSEIVEIILDYSELYSQLRSEVQDAAMSSSTDTLLATNLNIHMFSKWCWCEELPYGRKFLGQGRSGGWTPVEREQFDSLEGVKGWAWAFAIFLDMEVMISAATEGRLLHKSPPESDEIALTLHVNSKHKLQIDDVSTWDGRGTKVWWFRRDDADLDKKVLSLLRMPGWWEDATLKVGGLGMRCPKRVTIFRAELALYLN